MIDNESNYLSSLNNFILTLGVIVAFYQLIRLDKKFTKSKFSYLILGLLILFNLFIIFAIFQFHKRMTIDISNKTNKNERKLEENYKPILIIKGIILFLIQIIVTVFIVYDIFFNKS